MTERHSHFTTEPHQWVTAVCLLTGRTLTWEGEVVIERSSEMLRLEHGLQPAKFIYESNIEMRVDGVLVRPDTVVIHEEATDIEDVDILDEEDDMWVQWMRALWRLEYE